MKKLLFLAVLLSCTFFAQAQKNHKSPTERAQSKVDKLGETLNLSDAQKEQIYTLFVEEGQNGKRGGKKMSEFSKEERQAYIAQRKEQRAAFNTKMSEILTAEQYATYQEKSGKQGKAGKKGHGKHGEKGNHGKHGKHGGKGKMTSEEKVQKKLDKYTEQLQLTPAQQTQVGDLLAEQAANKPKKGAKKDSSEEEKAAAKAARKASRAAFDAKMQTILSADQYATFQAAKKEGKKAGSHKSRGPKNSAEMEGKKTGSHKSRGPKNSAEMVQKKVDKMTTQLQLTPTQQTQIKEVLTAHHANRPLKTAKDKSPAAKEARKAETAALQAKIKNILSETQYATFQNAEKSGRRKGNGRKGGKKLRKTNKQ